MWSSPIPHKNALSRSKNITVYRFDSIESIQFFLQFFLQFAHTYALCNVLFTYFINILHSIYSFQGTNYYWKRLEISTVYRSLNFFPHYYFTNGYLSFSQYEFHWEKIRTPTHFRIFVLNENTDKHTCTGWTVTG